MDSLLYHWMCLNKGFAYQLGFFYFSSHSLEQQLFPNVSWDRHEITYKRVELWPRSAKLLPLLRFLTPTYNIWAQRFTVNQARRVESRPCLVSFLEEALPLSQTLGSRPAWTVLQSGVCRGNAVGGGGCGNLLAPNMISVGWSCMEQEYLPL